MSSALAIAGVTAVLRDLLNDGVINHNVAGVVGSTVTVSALPPDRVVPAGAAENTQINIFLHQVSPNAAYRNDRLPSRDGNGRRLSNPPLALDLHYLVSAYGAAELHAEILLGYAMQLLHETPVLSRDAVRRALMPSPNVGAVLPPALRALADSGLADQYEPIRLTPVSMTSEEMSRLWSALGTHYRPTAAYLATVVLIEAEELVIAPLPVISRGPLDPLSRRERGVVVVPNLLAPFPSLRAVTGFGGEPVARLDDVVSLTGLALDGALREVLVTSDRFDVTEVLAATGAPATTSMQFVIPAARSADFPAGVYRVSARLVVPGEALPRETNAAGFAVLPWITGLPRTVARDVTGTARFTLGVQPQVRAGQSVSLVLGTREVLPEAFVAPVSSLDFVVPDAPVGAHLARLRVDGMESPIVDRLATPAAFLPQRVTIT